MALYGFLRACARWPSRYRPLPSKPLYGPFSAIFGHTGKRGKRPPLLRGVRIKIVPLGRGTAHPAHKKPLFRGYGASGASGFGLIRRERRTRKPLKRGVYGFTPVNLDHNCNHRANTRTDYNNIPRKVVRPQCLPHESYNLYHFWPSRRLPQGVYPRLLRNCIIWRKARRLSASPLSFGTITMATNKAMGIAGNTTSVIRSIGLIGLSYQIQISC